MANLPDIFVARKILSSKYQLYVCGKIFRAPRSRPNSPIHGRTPRGFSTMANGGLIFIIKSAAAKSSRMGGGNQAFQLSRAFGSGPILISHCGSLSRSHFRSWPPKSGAFSGSAWRTPAIKASVSHAERSDVAPNRTITTPLDGITITFCSWNPWAA